jgi:hypothetical protein
VVRVGLGDCWLASFRPPRPGASRRSHDVEVWRFWVVATGALALVARAGQRRLVVSPTEPPTWIPSSFPRFLIRKDLNQQG